MKTAAVFTMCCAGVQAFVPGVTPGGAFALKAAPSTSSTSSVVMMAEKSKALPFLDRPAALDGTMTGDFGFDPLGLSENINLAYAAEIKHGRVSMLAVVGFLTTQYVHLPGDMFNIGPLEAINSLPLASGAQVLAGIGIAELISIPKLTAEGTDPWEMLPQDPSAAKQFYKKSADKQETARLQEIKHGRLAMLAIIGEIVQMAILHKPSLEF